MSLFLIAKPRLTTCILSISFWCGLLLVSCTKQPPKAEQPTDTQLKYAKKFQIEGSSLSVHPFATANTYDLRKIPERIICTSTTHLHSLELLGLEEKLIGFANNQYIYSELFRSRAEAGLITDVGSDNNLNLELIIGLKPDLVIAFDMGTGSDALQRIENAGIPVVINADFQEETALGRAEWIKFFGAIFDRQAQADSIFNAIESRYLDLIKLTERADSRPTVLSGNVYGDTWFMPGGRNYSAQFFNDAGGRYAWDQDSTTSWLELSFESVYHEAKEVDFWIGVGSFGTLEGIKAQDERYTGFKAFQTGKVYNYDKRRVPNGGLDVFESGYTRPDLILADLIHVLHPALLPDHELYYYRQLQ